MKVLFTESTIKKVVNRLSREIFDRAATGGRAHGSPCPTLLCVLKGAAPFCADLSRALSKLGVECNIEYIRLKSYEGTGSSGKITVFDNDFDPSGRDIIVVEDICDSGRTLLELTRRLERGGAASVRSCVLLDKRCRRSVEFTPDFVGRIIDDLFVIGYGMDYEERFRELPHIAVFDNDGAV